MNKHQISRRAALSSLTSLPIVALGLATSTRLIQPAQYGTFLTRYTANLDEYWRMYRSSDAKDAMLAFQRISQALPALLIIVQDSTQYRQQALGLATRYAILKTLFGWTCIGPVETTRYAQTALALSRETGDISLQLSAYSKLSWAYFYDKKYSLAVKTAQQGEALLLAYQHQSGNKPLQPVVQAATYSTLALMQAANRQVPDNALGKATEINPGEESYAFMTLKQTTLMPSISGRQE